MPFFQQTGEVPWLTGRWFAFPDCQQVFPVEQVVFGVRVGGELDLPGVENSVGSRGENVVQKTSLFGFHLHPLVATRVLQPFNEHFDDKEILVIIARAARSATTVSAHEIGGSNIAHVCLRGAVQTVASARKHTVLPAKGAEFLTHRVTSGAAGLTVGAHGLPSARMTTAAAAPI